MHAYTNIFVARLLFLLLAHVSTRTDAMRAEARESEGAKSHLFTEETNFRERSADHESFFAVAVSLCLCRRGGRAQREAGAQGD